ncbi:hypothetical protein ACFWVP_16825 [Streptomyces sp. NPDC058637]|uniref:hypothetical protein n=1 Tax=Streptomyces sp. NPDC058637 TaxID=3346569 RepID=UPI003657A430
MIDLGEATRKLASTGAIRAEPLAHATRQAVTRLAADVFQLPQTASLTPCRA